MLWSLFLLIASIHGNSEWNPRSRSFHRHCLSIVDALPDEVSRNLLHKGFFRALQCRSHNHAGLDKNRNIQFAIEAIVSVWTSPQGRL